MEEKISRAAFCELAKFKYSTHQISFHTARGEPIAKVADDFIEKDHITKGEYDNISSCRYRVPDYWDIGAVFARLIEDCGEKEDVIAGLKEIYGSWLAEEIMNFNSDLYYQPRDYIAECYRAKEILPG